MSVGIAVIHDNPRLAVKALAYTNTFHGFFGLLHISVQHLPPICQVFGYSLIDAATRFLLVEKVIELIRFIINNVSVDGGIACVKEPLGFSFEVGEVLIGILIVNFVV